MVMMVLMMVVTVMVFVVMVLMMVAVFTEGGESMAIWSWLWQKWLRIFYPGD